VATLKRELPPYGCAEHANGKTDPSTKSFNVNCGGVAKLALYSTSSATGVSARGWLRTSHWPLFSHREAPSQGRQTRLLASGSQTAAWLFAAGCTSFRLKPEVIHCVKVTRNVDTPLASSRADSPKYAGWTLES
jgi:hypothetical protein